MKKFTHKQMKGATLTEVLLYLGIAAIIIVIAVSVYNNASNSSKLNQAKTQIQTIGGGIKGLFASQSTYTGLNTQLVVNAGLAPANAVNGNALINPWKGATNVSGSASYFEIEFENVPRESCVNILAAGLMNDGNIYRIQANTTAFTVDAPATPPSAVTACSSNTANSLTFRFR